MAEAHTVKESLRIDFTKQLLSLRDDDQITEIAFPVGLSNTERKFLHNLAGQLGLKSTSRGKEDARYITVSKLDEEEALLKAAVPFRFHASCADSMRAAFSKMPIRNVNVASPTPIAKDHNEVSFNIDSITKAHLENQAIRAGKPSFAEIQRKRAKLPSSQLREEVCRLVKTSQITLISGETGCGKTTQVPQFLLDDPDIGPSCRMIVTQPRRLSAVTVAERVSAEREEKIGTTVGYNIRFESESSRSTQVLFVTPGVLLRKLHHDPLLREYTHVLIDEAHERDKFTEFLFIILKDLCLRRASLKLVLMSATLNTSKLSAYFGGIPQINLGGSVFPVQEYYLEDVLRFTDHIVLSSEDEQNVSSVFARSYFCSVCGHGPFKVAEELGSHAAFCMLPPGRQLSARKESKSARKLDAIVKAIYSANAKPAMSLKSSVALNLPDVIEEKVEDVAEEADDDDEQLDEDMASKNVISVQALDSVKRECALEDFTGGDPLLRKYQIGFDDSLVDYDLIMALLGYVFRSDLCDDGSVLVFLPGWDDISELKRMLSYSHEYRNPNKFKICLLHSAVPRKDQAEAFLPAKKGQHKIILSTNVAETSITIDDVAVVIDSGKVKEVTYDPHVKLAFLKTTYVSKASARQRKGRAGRTRSGTCFHLFSKARHQSFTEFQDSELLRMPLEELVLQTKVLGLAPGVGGAETFLTKAMDPPHTLSIDNAIAVLRSIQCLDENEEVTIIGRSVSKLPIEPKSAYAILLGCVLGLGTDIVKTVAAMSRNPFIPPNEDSKRSIFNKVKGKLARSMPSDQIAVLNALDGYITKTKTSGAADVGEFCDQNFLSRTALHYLHDVTQQMVSLLDGLGIKLTHPRSSRNSGNSYLLMSIVGIGLYPEVCFRKKGGALFVSEKGPKAKIHPSSVNFQLSTYKKPCAGDLDIVGFETLVSMKTTSAMPNSASLYMIGTTAVSVFGFLLSSSQFRPITTEAANDATSLVVEVLVDEWIKFTMDRVTFQLMQGARSCLTEALVTFVLNPSKQLPSHIEKGLDAIASVLASELQHTHIKT